MVISVDAEKEFDQIQYPVMIKTLKRLEIERNFLNTIKAVYENSITNILSDERLKVFPLESRTRQRYPLLPLLFNIIHVILEVLARAIR